MAVFGRKSETAKPTPATTYSGAGNITQTRKSVVGKSLCITGELFSNEQILIEGKIEGNLNVRNRVIIGKSGIVNADIDADEVVIEGTVNGNVKGHNKVEIVPEGVLNGNVVSKRVVLADGAVFKGNIDMSLKDEN